MKILEYYPNIHLYSKEGIYNIIDINWKNYEVTLQTKRYKFKTPINNIKCFANHQKSMISLNPYSIKYWTKIFKENSECNHNISILSAKHNQYITYIK